MAVNYSVMTDHEFAIGYLNAVEKKYKDYFANSKLSINNCVDIEGEKIISVHVTNHNLPFEIRHDIETMFWVD